MSLGYCPFSIFYISIVLQANFFGRGAGYKSLHRYDVWFDKIDSELTGFMDFRSVRPSKYNKTTNVLRGSWELKGPFNDEIVTEIELFHFKGNEYRKIMDVVLLEICTKLITEPDFIPLMEKMLDFPIKGPCPIQPGRYNMLDFVLLNTQFPFEPFPGTDKYKLNVDYFSKGRGKLLSHTEWSLIVIRRGLFIG